MKYAVIFLIFTPLLTSSKYVYNSNKNGMNYIVSKTRYPPPPPVDDPARMARYVVHFSDWITLSHISHQKEIPGLPMGKVYSMSDGPLDKSSGIPYIYTSFMDASTKDLKEDNRCSMTMSLAQNDFCVVRHLDPEDPRCPQVILFGNFIFINNNTEEWKTAENALFSRHPSMKQWPESHNFQFGKLDIKYINIRDSFGGIQVPTVEDYFKAKPTGVNNFVSVERV